MHRLRATLVRTTPFVFAAFIAALASGAARASGSPAPAQQGSGWQLPPEARTVQNPRQVDDKLLAVGRRTYGDKCRKCHGPEGLGDGPDADPEHAESMNLTNPKRADRNPDGVVFYKIMNGRTKPKMPAFREELSEEQVWAVVAYVQSLRKK